jgi:hypothetical protein
MLCFGARISRIGVWSEVHGVMELLQWLADIEDI